MFRLGDVEFSYVRCAIFLLAWGWPIVLVLHLSVNFHHYLVDGVVWTKRGRSAAAVPRQT